MGLLPVQTNALEAVLSTSLSRILGGSAHLAMPASTYSPALFTHSESQRAAQSQYSGLEPSALEYKALDMN